MQKPLWHAKAFMTCKSLYDRVFSTGALGPRGDHGAVPRGPRAETFSLLNTVALPWYCKTLWWAGGHKRWEPLEGGHKPWRLRTTVSWPLPNLESAHIKFRMTTWLMRIVCYLSYETCWRFWSASVCWNSFQRWQQYWGRLAWSEVQ